MTEYQYNVSEGKGRPIDSSRPPAETRVPPLEALDLRLRQALQFRLDISAVPPLVVPLHPHDLQRRDDEDEARGREVEAVADLVVGGVERQVGPGSDEATNITEHDVTADGDAAARVAHDDGRRLRVRERADGEAADGREEGRGVPHAGHLARQEQDVPQHREGRRGDDEGGAAVAAPAAERQADDEDGAQHVRRDREQLLLDGRLGRVDGGDDGRREEREALHRDVVEEEDEGRRQHHRVPEAQPQLAVVGLVEHAGLCHALGLDARDGEVLLLLREPARRLRAVGEREERDDGQPDGDDSFDAEDHAPRVQASKVVQCEDSGCQQAPKRAR